MRKNQQSLPMDPTVWEWEGPELSLKFSDVSSLVRSLPDIFSRFEW